MARIEGEVTVYVNSDKAEEAANELKKLFAEWHEKYTYGHSADEFKVSTISQRGL